MKYQKGVIRMSYIERLKIAVKNICEKNGIPTTIVINNE